MDAILEKVSFNRFVIVHSPPASGKTSILQLIANKCGRDKVVKYIRLR